jgi:CheY-like chemotaxis protein
MSAATILLVDDNEDVREIIALALRDFGYSVFEASDGNAALGLLGANYAIELLLIDFVMPKMSGTELLARARVIRPEIKAAFITGDADRTRHSAKFAGELVIIKPFTVEQLALMVRKALDQFCD